MQETITPIALEDLHESPFNPRKTFTDIAELADTIKAEGRIHSPLLVRPRLTNPLRDDLNDGYEIVFGHRRYRAAETLGLATVPCMVRALSDAEARSAQIAENLARQDVHPIEEAEGFAALIEQDGITAEDLATRIGKSRSHVYGRLTLLKACAEIRAACLAGEIGSEVALLIARLRTDKLQAKALAAIRNDTSQHAKLEDGGKKSFRHIRDLLAEKFTLDLKTAIFNREDDALLPGAGVCSACPKRTGNAPEYADLAAPSRDGVHRGYTAAGGPNTCTDPECFDAKKQAHLAQQAAQLAATGVQVVTGNKARAAISAHGDVKGDYVALADVQKLLKAGKGKAAQPPAVQIQDPRTGKLAKAVKRADLVAAGLLKPEQAQAPRDDHEARYKREAEKRKAQEAKAVAVSACRMALLRHVRTEAARRQRDTFDLRLCAAAALGGVSWQDKPTLAAMWDVKSADALSKRVDTMSASELSQLLMDCAIVDDVLVSWHNVDNSKPGPLLALAEHYGIDAKAVLQAALHPKPEAAAPTKATPTPSTAGAGAKKATAARAQKAALGKGIRYRCAATGSTWSGKGLQPTWLKVALAHGKTLADFDLAAPKAQDQKVKVDAGSAGERCAHTGDLLEAAGA